MKTNPKNLIIAFLLGVSILLTACNSGSESSSEAFSESVSESMSNTNSEEESSNDVSSLSTETQSNDENDLSSDDMSEETSKSTSEESSVSSVDESKEIIDSSSEITSEEFSESESKENNDSLSETTSKEQTDLSTDDTSEDISKEISDITSDESSEDTSEPISNESSEVISEEAKKINQEIMQEFPDLDFAYALYDIKTGNTIVNYNTNELFSMSYTIKPAYVLYLLSEENVNLTDTITFEIHDIDFKGRSYIRDYREIEFNYGDSLSVETLIEYAIVKNDNTAYRMLTKQYGYDGFNAFMQKLNIDIRLGNEAIGADKAYTSATIEEQLKAWIAINNYIDNSSERATFFAEILKNKDGLKLVEQFIEENTASILGWAHRTSSLHECYFVDNKYIAIILTTTNQKLPESMNITTINTKPLETIAIKLNDFWKTNCGE